MKQGVIGITFLFFGVFMFTEMGGGYEFLAIGGLCFGILGLAVLLYELYRAYRFK